MDPEYVGWLFLVRFNHFFEVPLTILFQILKPEDKHNMHLRRDSHGSHLKSITVVLHFTVLFRKGKQENREYVKS